MFMLLLQHPDRQRAADADPVGAEAGRKGLGLMLALQVFRMRLPVPRDNSPLDTPDSTS